MKKMTRNEFLKMAGTSAALVVFNTVLSQFLAKPSGAMLVHVHLIICLKGISNGRLPFRVQ